MRNTAVVAFAALFFASCGSVNNAKVKIADPEIHLVQLSAQPQIAEHVTGGIPIDFGVSVTNHANIPITLKRINIQSMGSGGYNVPSSSKPFDKVIAPEATEQMEFWVGAFADVSVAGVNGAVAIRVIAQFDSPQGSFENTTVHQVEGRLR
jgi:hypothetical protein